MLHYRRKSASEMWSVGFDGVTVEFVQQKAMLRYPKCVKTGGY